MTDHSDNAAAAPDERAAGQPTNRRTEVEPANMHTDGRPKRHPKPKPHNMHTDAEPAPNVGI